MPTVVKPDPEDVDVQFSVGVQSRKMNMGEAFTPTNIHNETFQLHTDLDEYLSRLPAFAEVIYEYILDQRADGWINFLQIEVRLDNATAVPMGAGAYPLPKGHRSAGLTGDVITDQEVIEKSLSNIVADLQQAARY